MKTVWDILPRHYIVTKHLENLYMHFSAHYMIFMTVRLNLHQSAFPALKTLCNYICILNGFTSKEPFFCVANHSRKQSIKYEADRNNTLDLKNYPPIYPHHKD